MRLQTVRARQGHMRGGFSKSFSRRFCPLERLSLGQTVIWKNNVRIVLVSQAVSGGVASHLAELIRGLAGFPGVQLYLILSEGEQLDQDILSADILALTQATFFTPLVRSVGPHDVVHGIRLYRLLRRIKPDIVHSHSSKAGALARLCLGGWKQIYTPHAIYTLRPDLGKKARLFYLSIERVLGAWATDGIVAVSDEEAAHIMLDIRPGTTKIATIYNGISGANQLSRAAARRELGIADNERIVGFVGRLEAQKGIDRLIAAAAAMEKRYDLEDVRVFIIGPGDITANLPAGARMPKCVTLTGPIPKAARLFRAFDVFVLLSRYEGFPYVYLEADVAEVLIVSTPVAGAEAFVRHGKRGFILENADDPIAFADAIAAALCNGKAKRAERAPSDDDRFTAKRMCMDTMSLYRSLLAVNTTFSKKRDFHD